MRLLVACAECKRQYDASELAEGSRFRCLCGSILLVHRPEAHEAAVVRCSSCGAPRQAGSPRCHFCDADFTLHERDLHTICPECMTRVSDHARFCHHCASPLMPSGKAGSPSERTCPACGNEQQLSSRRIGEPGIGVLECPQCAGLWLAGEEFELLLKRVRSMAASTDEEINLDSRGQPTARTAGQSGSLYRPCPICGKLMHRRNFGRKSGVIIDHCRPHGFWFDGQELEAVLRWAQQGGEIAVRRREEEEAREAKRRQSLDRQLKPLDSEWPRSYRGARTLIDLLDWLAIRIR
jgi:Zn-finger nucleic acid-binding protein/DNA-directed RNA polymerase subunit RPC12/RpoP